MSKEDGGPRTWSDSRLERMRDVFVLPALGFLVPLISLPFAAGWAALPDPLRPSWFEWLPIIALITCLMLLNLIGDVKPSLTLQLRLLLALANFAVAMWGGILVSLEWQARIIAK